MIVQFLVAKSTHSNYIQNFHFSRKAKYCLVFRVKNIFWHWEQRAVDRDLLKLAHFICQRIRWFIKTLKDFPFFGPNGEEKKRKLAFNLVKMKARHALRHPCKSLVRCRAVAPSKPHRYRIRRPATGGAIGAPRLSGVGVANRARTRHWLRWLRLCLTDIHADFASARFWRHHFTVNRSPFGGKIRMLNVFIAIYSNKCD